MNQTGELGAEVMTGFVRLRAKNIQPFKTK